MKNHIFCHNLSAVTCVVSGKIELPTYVFRISKISTKISSLSCNHYIAPLSIPTYA